MPATSDRASRRADGPDSRRPRRPVSVVGVFGELLLTAGVVILLFLAWQLWWNDAIMDSQQSSSAADLMGDWEREAREQPVPEDFGDPVVLSGDVENAETFAVMYVPRFGENSQRRVAEGTGLDVLNSSFLGVGHYPGTAMPGGVGNFALASHRSAYGGGMHEIEQLQLGDKIYIRTADGWFTYAFRDFEYVTPETMQVLAPVPHQPEAEARDRIIALTTCNPLFSTAERIIAYGVMEGWRPAAAGPPDEIAADVAAWEE